MTWYLWLWLFLSIVLGAFGQIFMKMGMLKAGPVPLQGGLWPLAQFFVSSILSLPLAAAAFCYGLSFLLWLAVLSMQDLSLTRPLMSLGYLITLGYGIFAGEQVSAERIAGTLLIITGIFFVVKSGIS